MKARTLGSLAQAVAGTASEPTVQVDSVVTDSRMAAPGSLFVALVGDRVDGHGFVADAAANGAAAVMVRRGADVMTPAVFVEDTGTALLALAADERLAFEGTVVAITGANGKTTTKDLTAAVAAARFRTHASPDSFNTEVGVPLTLLRTPEDTEVIVAELGARHVGDVALLCPVADPQIVVVTNVGVAHMEIFGSWEAIVAASAEPVEALRADAVAVLNADDPVVASYASRTIARVRTFGRSADADVRAEDVVVGHDGCAGFDVAVGHERAAVSLGIPGEHMVANALAAIAVGIELGIPLETCAEALAGARITRWRMETTRTSGGVTVVNDAYNASPESMAAALRTARWMAQDGRLIAVLGQMAELGPIAAAEHEKVGELAARLHVDRLVTVGTEAKAVAV
ncbi:MAG TPA: UDP-N-acetylmuramoyl-tripeptide--D-alanyl-D-alanine ligase, partial [Ilumatobacteraceae bacterium]|nr:UDP-N-acetylmuramoyl-tripeptide--D-alanyl-D-alanine ligase [Ilumatobacteraceae bacterium]